jgi:beta-glucosidase
MSEKSSQEETRIRNFKFPKDFFWGAATSAHQVEGNTSNNWTEWEKENAERLAKESHSKFGHLPNWKDIEAEATDPDNYISGRACDHYNRYEEDFNIAKELGHNAHRFSIEWSRIEPEEGKFDEAEIEHYRDVIISLRKRGLEPFVTLWHWTNPTWISDDRGWENKKTVAKFLRYVERITHEYKNIVNFWMPLSEPGTYIGMSYIQGAFPPQKRLSLFSANRAFKNLMSAYRQTYRLIHSNNPEAKVGMSHYAVYMFPYKNRIWNNVLVKILDYIRNWRFLDSVNDTNDFIGIQYYHTDNIKFSPFMNGKWGFIDTRNKNSWVTDIGWDIYPEGIYYLLKRAQKYKKPIYITENGIADKKDFQREKFIRENLKQISRAILEGADVKGYFYWSLLDNFEWDKGFWPRFGLIEINYETLERKIRPSALIFRDIIKNQSV